MLDIIEIFEPLLSKYARLLDGEDTKQDLIIHLIDILNKIPIDKEDIPENKYILGYIAKSIRNEYIKISKKNDKIRLNETELNLDIELQYEDSELEFEMMDMFKILTKKEVFIMKLIYVYYLSVSEVANYMKISRQAVNQAKNRSLKKLREIYLNKD
nr:sigma-70 family RNA polymerase sigma factor [Clostridium sp. 1001275B_160808_H3]